MLLLALDNAKDDTVVVPLLYIEYIHDFGARYVLRIRPVGYAFGFKVVAY